MKITTVTPAQAQAAYDNMTPPEVDTIDRADAISTLTELLIAGLDDGDVREILCEVLVHGWSDRLGPALNDLSNEELTDMYNEHSGEDPIEVVS
jgi:hypothetical protein